MWTKVLHSDRERWHNESVDDLMAYRLGMRLPGPDGRLTGWRMWDDEAEECLVCEPAYLRSRPRLVVRA